MQFMLHSSSEFQKCTKCSCFLKPCSLIFFILKSYYPIEDRRGHISLYTLVNSVRMLELCVITDTKSKILTELDVALEVTLCD